MNNDHLISFLKANILTKDLSQEELHDLLPFLETKTIPKGELVFHEGDAGRELYLLIEGHLAVLKHVEDLPDAEHIAVLTAGHFFGEMAHLENEKRSASIRAMEPSEVLIVYLDKLQADEGKKILYSKIVTQLAKKVSSNLRKTDSKLIDSLREKIKMIQVHSQISVSIVHIIVLVAVWFNLALVANFFPEEKPFLKVLFTPALLVLFAISTIYVIKKSGYPPSFYGFTTKHWFTYSVQAILYSLPFMLLMFILKYVLIHNFDEFKELHLFNSIGAIKKELPIIIAYMALAPVQEMIARGAIQSCFRNFFQGPNRVFLAILVSNLIFEMLHTTVDVWLALISLVFGFFWGFLFESQKSVIGVGISHAILGAWGFFILDFQTVFELALVWQR